MVKVSLERMIAGAAGLVLALGFASLLSCSSSPQSSPRPLPTRTNTPPSTQSSQSQPRQTPRDNAAYEHPNFATVAVDPERFSGQNIELTGYWVETSSGALRLGYGVGSKRVLTNMRSDESSPLASKYNDFICGPKLSSMDPNSGEYTTTLRGTMRNGRLMVQGGYITGPDGHRYEF
jgi:hypothetical protein